MPFDLANEINPVHYAEGWMPGFGDVRSDTYTGLWHFIHMDRTGEYNTRPGMSYMYAGPNANPGAFDLAIMAMADMTGLSLNAYASDGDDIYGDLDDVNRAGPGPWQSESIGHIEFSPLDNLALYGWNKYIDEGATSAEGLSWPLHALGDATEPHHVVGSTGLGHRPYEDAVSKVLKNMIPPTANLALHDALLEGALVEGFDWWLRLQSSADVRAYIEAVARNVRDRIQSDGDWPYRDELSQAYLRGEDSSVSGYDDSFARMQSLVRTSIAATLAFLTHAGTFAHEAPLADTQCPSGTGYDILAGGCIAVPPDPNPNNCATGQASCAANSDCSTGMVCFEGCCYVDVQ